MTPHEAAKNFIRPYVLRGDSVQSITDGGMGCACRLYWAQIGGCVQVNGKRKNFNRYQLIVTKIEGQPCLAVFNVHELVAEIKNGEQLSLWNEVNA